MTHSPGGKGAALLPLPGRRRRRAWLDAGGTRLRLRSLAVMGHGSARIARAAGASEQAVQKLARGDARTVSPQLADAIAAVYDAWWDKRPPERRRRELVRRRGPGRRPARRPRLPARLRLAARQRNRRGRGHSSARTRQTGR